MSIIDLALQFGTSRAYMRDYEVVESLLNVPWRFRFLTMRRIARTLAKDLRSADEEVARLRVWKTEAIARMKRLENEIDRLDPPTNELLDDILRSKGDY